MRFHRFFFTTATAMHFLPTHLAILRRPPCCKSLLLPSNSPDFVANVSAKIQCQFVGGSGVHGVVAGSRFFQQRRVLSGASELGQPLVQKKKRVSSSRWRSYVEARDVKEGAMETSGAAEEARVLDKQGESSEAVQEPRASDSQEVPVTIKVSEEAGQIEPMGPDSNVKDGVNVEKSIWSKMGQRVNLAGIQFATQIILRDQHLAIPHVSVPDIRWIDWKALQEHGFEGVVFDKDNTLTAPYALAVWPALATSLQECQSVFENRIALLSNSAGLYQFDPDGVEAKALEERLGIPVIRHGTKKPAGTAEDISKHFSCDPSRLIMVGDRYFTDIVYGNNNGLLTIRPAPLTPIGEPFVVRQVRALEEAVVGRWLSQEVQPKAHALFTNPYDFIKDPACW